ncbi:expressed unknown protein [Seminavis robusta]|uniref:Uncharacterized protein n=1 Tax=Seminavis robusta TaxID=568900 RepID=A0A9N8H9M8_9STRA|nr:expressed unknown protein [Seminavis robusta]|eukprot:Sro122_g059070.2  (132) ;mRNA; f:10316-11244
MITVLKSCIMAEGDTNPMRDDALAEMQIDEVRAPLGPDNCGPFWRWEISEEQLVECVKDKIPLVLRSYVDPEKKGKIQLHTILNPQDQVYCLNVRDRRAAAAQQEAEVSKSLHHLNLPCGHKEFFALLLLT